MDTAAVILAGGQSRRFGGQPKALNILGDMSLIEHVIGRLSPQVEAMALSVERRNPLFNTFSLEQIEDPKPGAQGPLPALLATLKWLRQEDQFEWVQLAPCDTPFIPKDLVGRLSLYAAAQEAQGCLPSFRGVLHPTCGLWHVSLVDVIEKAVDDGLRGFKQFLEVKPVSIMEWPESYSDAPDPFFNINTPAHLRRAEKLI